MVEGRNHFFNQLSRIVHEVPLVDKMWDKRSGEFMDNARIREYLRPMIQEKGEKIKVLSIGSGKGHEIDWLDSVLEGVDVTGVDPNDFWIKRVQKRLDTPGKFGDNTAEYLPPEARAEELVGVKDASMDAAVMFFVLHHIDEEKNKQALQELNRVLRANGLAFIAEDIVDSEEERRVTTRQDRLLNAEITDDGHHNYKSVEEWKEFFGKYGFQVKEYNEVKPGKVRNGFFVLEKIEDFKQEK